METSRSTRSAIRSVRERLAGVATLATPFLIAKRREPWTQGLILFCVGFLGWGWLAGELLRRFVWPSAEWVPAIVGTVLFMSATVLVARLSKRAGKVAKDLRLPVPAQERLWIARISGDEATAGLQGRIYCRNHRRPDAVVFRSGQRLGRKDRRGLVAQLCLARGRRARDRRSFWAVRSCFGVDDRSAPVLWAFIIAIGIGGLITLWGLVPQVPRVVAPFATGLVAPLAFALPILLVLPFGPAVAVYSFLLELSAGGNAARHLDGSPVRTGP